MYMAQQSLNFAVKQEAPAAPWRVVGKGWYAKGKGKGINVVIGNSKKVTKADGTVEYVEQIGDLLLVPGSKLFITPTDFTPKEGATTTPPQFLVKLVPATEKE
jgi:hypothetical protein